MDPQFLELLSSLTPEEMEQLMGMGTLDERSALVQQQLSQAEGLRAKSGAEWAQGPGASGLSAALGGLGGLANSIAGTVQGGRASEELQGLLGKKDAGRNLYAQLLRRQGQGAPAVQPAAGPAMPFGRNLTHA
jgi:hypothetical protein